MKQWKLLTAAVLVMLLLLSACAGDPDTSSVSPAPSGSESSTVTDAGDTSAQPDESQPAGDEGAASTPDVEGEPEKEPEPTPEQTPAAEPEKEPEQPAHEHKYDSTVIAATCEAGGYTLHQCACGEQYKDAETKATGHTYQSKVTAPTCTKGGYTTYTCACGDSRTGDETKATGHKYGQKIIAPTTQAEGYTLNTCAVCGDSYKSDIVDKLPEASAKPEDNKSDDEWENTNGEGDSHIEAGVFATGNSKTAPVYSGSNNIQDVLGDINGYVGNVYDYRFYATGIGKNDNAELGTAMISQNSDGKFGITVYGWRHSYDSGTAENKVLNVVLEAMRYFAGGKSNVAYSLWSFCDYKNINGSANSDNFGFHDVEKTSIGWIIEMDGVKILLDNTVSGQTTYWFI